MYAESVGYLMVYVSVREDNPQALAIELLPVQTHKPYNTCIFLIVLACICSLCILWDI